MGLRHRIIGISLLFGFVTWIADAGIDAVFFYEAAFLDLLLLDIPPHEVYFRGAIIVSYLIFGVIAAHLITQRLEKQTELANRTEELETTTRQLQDQYRTLFEEAPIMAALTRSEDGRPIIEDCNERFITTLGFEKETVRGSELSRFYTDEAREELIDENGFSRAMQGEFTNERRTLRSKDGTNVETVLRAVPRTYETGEIIGTLAMYVDITEREQVKEANEKLEEFTHVVSHDLRNPLNVVEGRLELAQEECDSEHLGAIEDGINRMETLIEDLLALAREGEEVGELEIVDITELARSCWSNVDTEAADIDLAFDRRIRADRSRVQQLLENLFRNAIEHGGENVRITGGELDDGFFIEDDGQGIPRADQEEVVERGYSTSAGGTGMGLSIVETVADAHGWNIVVTEADSGGARFEFHDVAVVEE